MKRNEKIVIHGNEFYVIDLDCLEKKKRAAINNQESYPKPGTDALTKKQTSDSK